MVPPLWHTICIICNVKQKIIDIMKKPKLNPNAQKILKMLQSTIAEDAARWLDVILDDLAETVDQRAVCEYIFYDEYGKFIASSCYVSTPRMGEVIEIGNFDYEVLRVKHVFDRSRKPGTIIVKSIGPAEIELDE